MHYHRRRNHTENHELNNYLSRTRVRLRKPNMTYAHRSLGKLMKNHEINTYRTRSKKFPGLTRTEQLGLDTEYGAETDIHTIRAFADEHEDKASIVIVQLDFSNAFNLVSRAASCEKLYKYFSSRALRVHFWYGDKAQHKYGQTTSVCYP